jgi:hypothetical protein
MQDVNSDSSSAVPDSTNDHSQVSSNEYSLDPNNAIVTPRMIDPVVAKRLKELKE